jgi:hypothetical protein
MFRPVLLHRRSPSRLSASRTSRRTWRHGRCQSRMQAMRYAHPSRADALRHRSRELRQRLNLVRYQKHRIDTARHPSEGKSRPVHLLLLLRASRSKQLEVFPQSLATYAPAQGPPVLFERERLASRQTKALPVAQSQKLLRPLCLLPRFPTVVSNISSIRNSHTRRIFRTSAGWRSYGLEEVIRAGQIASLRPLGLSSAQAGRVLEGDSGAVECGLAAHEVRLRDQAQQIANSLSRVRRLRSGLAQGHSPTAEVVLAVEIGTRLTVSLICRGLGMAKPLRYAMYLCSALSPDLRAAAKRGSPSAWPRPSTTRDLQLKLRVCGSNRPDSAATVDKDRNLSNSRLHEQMTEGVDEYDFRMETRAKLLAQGVPVSALGQVQREFAGLPMLAIHRMRHICRIR